VQINRTVNHEGKVFNYPSMAWLDFTLGDPNRGYTEKRNVKRALQLMKPTDVVADVGGFIGEMSIHWAKHVQSIDLFEASPKMAEIARLNMLQNQITNCYVNNYAIGAMAGIAQFHFNEHQPVLSGIHQAGRRHFIPETVRVITLDSMNVAYDYVKIDVEGAEMDVLEGMQHLLEEVEPVIQIELMEENLKRAGCSVRLVERYILEHGYVGTDCRGKPLNVANMPGKDGFFLPKSRFS
jgi:FkbM family methyltransferase